ncbi:MAG: hypothetical protein AUH92_01470 [Acidobacteria bacterium 13_1_40CM_4_69_4]|nr:MAG: hypothetical protein AUH92_01470 [Acidobacteria bacterium 13_1_40CM_4_69_4]
MKTTLALFPSPIRLPSRKEKRPVVRSPSRLNETEGRVVQTSRVCTTTSTRPSARSTVSMRELSCRKCRRLKLRSDSYRTSGSAGSPTLNRSSLRITSSRVSMCSLSART